MTKLKVMDARKSEATASTFTRMTISHSHDRSLVGGHLKMPWLLNEDVILDNSHFMTPTVLDERGCLVLVLPKHFGK